MNPQERAIKIAATFQEKHEEISADVITAFGIVCETRYGKCYEMEEMLAFCRECAHEGAATFVARVFYDSKSGCATIAYHPEGERNWTVVQAVEAIADRTFSQYQRQDGTVNGKFDGAADDL